MGRDDAWNGGNAGNWYEPFATVRGNYTYVRGADGDSLSEKWWYYTGAFGADDTARRLSGERLREGGESAAEA